MGETGSAKALRQEDYPSWSKKSKGTSVVRGDESKVN